MLHDNQTKTTNHQPSPSRRCVLTRLHEGLPYEGWKAEIKVGHTVLDGRTVKTQFFKNVMVPFLLNSGCGLHPNDINAALATLEENGHNVIEFGLFGAPTTTLFEGSLQ